MVTYPNIDPVAFYLIGWPIHWYGLTYLIGIVLGWGLLSQRIRRNPSNLLSRRFTQDELSDIIFYSALGIILGGRLGYMLFYSGSALLTDPFLILQVWKGGMSFHGGLLGVVIALFYCSRKLNKSFLALTDLITPVVPVGLATGRIGNFINGELWGKATDVPWAMIFPNAGLVPRHPSQLYEFALEGILLFIILWLYSAKPRPLGAVSGLFALGYGVFRSFVEFYREPDQQIGYVAFGWMTEGQLLSLPLIIVGIALLVWAYKRN